MRNDWLIGKTTVEVVEEKYFKEMELYAHSEQANKLNPRWGSFKAQIEPGDELWEYCSPMESWEARCGRAGFAILRDGKVVASYLRMMN
jgi:hypothetical protein